jgi:beta-barrel assembly-enhancing protease
MPSDMNQPPGQWTGHYADGNRAASRPVVVEIGPDGLRLTDQAGLDLVWPLATLTVGQPIHAATHDIVVSNGIRSGQSLFVADAGFVRALAKRAPQTSQTAFRRAGLRVAAPVGLAAAFVATAIAALDLSPSKAIARLIPEAARDRIGENVLATLPARRVCTAPEGVAALDGLVTRLRPDLKGKPHKVRVLDWSLVNAFAVPGGSVVLTSAILRQAASVDEIAGVLAHEMGHGSELHPEAGLVRGIGFWALVQMMFTGSPGATGNLGTVLLQLAYTRGYEREADAVALKLLRDAGISSKPFAGFFRRMEQRKGTSDRGSPRSRTSEIFQTHPSSPERIAQIENQPPYNSRPALTDQQWQALKNICGTTSGPASGPLDTTNTDIKPKSTPVDSGLKEADARIASNPTAASGYAERGAIHLRERRFGDAVADYGRAIEREPTNAFYRYERGRAHQNASNFEAALKDYGEAIRLNPRYSNAYAARGASHRLANRLREARVDLDEAIRINPRNDYALYQRGLINAAETRWAESEADFARIVTSQKAYALAHVRRAEALEQLKRRDDAIAAYTEALAGSPSSPDAAIAFGIARDRLAALNTRP